MNNSFENESNKSTRELSPGELFIAKLGLNKGVLIKLDKISSSRESKISVGDSIEGILDDSVHIGRPIFLNNRAQNTSNLIGVREENKKIFFKTETSIYELVPPTLSPDFLNVKTQELKDLKNRLSAMLKEAQDNALSNIEMTTLFQRRIALSSMGDIKQKELIQIDEKLKKCRINVNTLIEYKILLNMLGKNYYRVNKALMHENAHANKANSVGAFHLNYSLIVSKGEDGEFKYQPLAQTKIPENWTEKAGIIGNIDIGQAPEEYGDSLSGSDEEMVEKLKERLKNINNK